MNDDAIPLPDRAAPIAGKPRSYGVVGGYLRL